MYDSYEVEYLPIEGLLSSSRHFFVELSTDSSGAAAGMALRYEGEPDGALGGVLGLGCHTLPLCLHSIITPFNSAPAHFALRPSLPVSSLKSRSPTPSLQETLAWTQALWSK